MSFLISPAWAQQAPASAGPADLVISLIFPIGLLVLLYFLMIRPQIKRQKEHNKMVAGLAKGDEVVTMGGLAGRIVDLSDGFAQVEIADGVQVKIRRHSVETVLPKGSMKDL
jgi:preprotein translocase subunit YajC